MNNIYLNSSYDIKKSYDENYNNPPSFKDFKINNNLPKKNIKIWDFTLNSPLGIPAGPLLNSEFIKFYANLGFDIPMYKTVRTNFTKSHPFPNCLFLNKDEQLTKKDIKGKIFSRENQDIVPNNLSITNSFGMPSKDPSIWQKDIDKANSYLKKGQLMIVSCVGTHSKERNLINDFAYCANLAKDSGAKAIEINFSCPNVVSKTGSIYQDVHLAREIAFKTKKVLKNIPLMLKIGYIDDLTLLNNLLKSCAPFIDGVSAINTIPMNVFNMQNKQALSGNGRLQSGVCGDIIRDLGLKMIKNISDIKIKNNYDFIICGVGGITKYEHFNSYLNNGADIAMSATGAMWDFYLAEKWKLS